MSSPKTTDYPIRDVDGTVKAIHRRIDGERGGKRFSWLLPDGTTSSGQIRAADVPLYLSETLAAVAPDSPVIVAEGEKATDALAAHEFVAVGTVTGAPAAPGAAPLSALAGRDVVLWPDHDDVGRKQMARVAERLAGIVRSVRVIAWGEEDGDDAADFFARGGTADGCRVLVDAARVVETQDTEEPAPVSAPPKPLGGNGRHVSTLAERIAEACAASASRVLAFFASHGLSDLKPNGPDGWHRGCAAWHGDGRSPGFSVHPSTGSWCDHRDGESTGNLIEFLQARASLSHMDAAREVCRVLGIEWREDTPAREEAKSEAKRLTELGRAAVAGKLAGKDPMQVVDVLKDDDETKRALAFFRAYDTTAFVSWFGSLRPRGMARYVLQVLNTVDVPKPAADESTSHSEMLSRSLDKIARGKRASIKLSDGDFEKQLDESIAALCAENADRIAVNKFGDALFQKGDSIVRISDTSSVPVPQKVTPEKIRIRLANCAAYYTERMGEDGPQAVREYPPRDIAVSILHRHAVGLPELEGIVSHPVLVKDTDGSTRVVAKVGYDASSKLLLHGFDGDALPSEATREDGQASCRWIRTEVLCDFPFAGPAEVAHAYALILLPFVRRMIHGCTPFHLVDASGQGAGKGLINDVCASFAIADAARISIPFCRDEEEWRKQITVAFKTEAEMATIDNMTGKIDSAIIAAVLTMEEWTDRVLGTSDPTRFRNRMIWAATANNLTLNDDIARRVVRIRIEPQCENPSMRRGFRHEDLKEWMRENRSTCLRHAWTCVLSWAKAGCPLAETPPMGSFHSWARVVGSLLSWLGVDGFLQNRADVQTVSVSDSAMLQSLAHVWWERHGSAEVTSEQLLDVAEEVEYPIRGESDRERRLSVCWSVRKLRGRWIDGMQVTYLPQDHKVRRIKATFRLTKRDAF